MNNGVTPSTPARLVDRIVFSNWVCLVVTLNNFLGAQANLRNGYHLLLAINGLYQLAIILTWLINRSQFYLTARLFFLGSLYAGIIFSCAIQGPAFQMEYFLLPLAVLSMSLFHPTERRWAWLFVSVSFFAFHFFAVQSGPILDIDPSRGLYKLEDLRINQISYTLGLVLTLLGLSNAYFRASKLVDEQRTRTFYENRLSNLGLISCNVAHELNSPLAALNLHAFRLKERFTKTDVRPELVQDTDRILKLSARLSTIVQSFKQLSNQTDNEAPRTTSLAALFQLTTDLSVERLKRFGIQLEMNLREPDAQVHCQIVAISQALFCLIDNAIDAIAEMPGDRWIRVESFPTTSKVVRIQITDSGAKPDFKTANQMFDAFFTTKPLGRGIGIGLTIARQIFESHAGTLRLDEASEHTSFIIELPAVST